VFDFDASVSVGTECDMELGHVGVPVTSSLALVMGEVVVLNVGSPVGGVNEKSVLLTGVLSTPEDDAFDVNVGEDGRTNPGGQITTHSDGIPEYEGAALMRLDTVLEDRLAACVDASG
jgi:hypothetical protein